MPPFQPTNSSDSNPQPRGSKTSHPELGAVIGASAAAFALMIVVLVVALIACIRILYGQKKKKMRVTTTSVAESSLSQTLQTGRGTPVGETASQVSEPTDSGATPSTRSTSPETTEPREHHGDGSQSTPPPPPTVLNPATTQTQPGFVTGFGLNSNP